MDADCLLVLYRTLTGGGPIMLLQSGCLSASFLSWGLAFGQLPLCLSLQPVSMPLAMLVQTSLGLYQSPISPGR